MASEKLTDRTLFAGTLNNSDLIHIVDVSDTTQDPAGSSYKLSLTQLKTFVRDNIYNSDGTLSANRTITQAGFYLSHQGGVVGFGTVPDSDARVHIQGAGATASTFGLKVKNSAGSYGLIVRDDLRVGINTDDLVSPLSIYCDSSNRGIQIAQNSGTYRIHIYSNNGVGAEDGQVNFSSPNSDYRFWTGSITGHTTATNHLFTIHANGRVSVVRSKSNANYGGWNFYIEGPGNDDRGIWVRATGAGATTWGGYFESITGAATNKIGIYATASGGTNNYAAIFDSGFVGIGETVPTAKIHIKGTGNASGTFSMKVFNSDNENILSVRNDNRVLINDPTAIAANAALQVKGYDTGLGGGFSVWFGNSDGSDIFAFSDHGNVCINATNDGGGQGVVIIRNASVAPTVQSTGAGIVYVEGGALKYIGSAGTFTTLAPA